ncbi:MAG TPA: hypothetical protein VJV78_38945 [Polyangiales bacterium]|nr:hypothetical protein [Polyangiales bacterium]
MKNARQRRLMLITLVFACGLGAACEQFRKGENVNGANIPFDDKARAMSGRAGSASDVETGTGNNSSSRGGGAGADSDVPVVPNDGACRDGVPANARPVSGRLEQSTTWAGVVHLDGDVTLRGSGTKLTIQAGTQIFVDAERMLEIGWNSTEHTIDAQGTAEAPIRFCRSQKTGRNWKGIDVGGNVTSSSTLKYVVIEGAGAGADALVLRKGIVLDHVTVRDSASNGVNAVDFRDDSSTLTVTKSAKAPLVLTDAWALQRLPEGGTYTGNGEDVAHLSFANVTIELQVRELGVPYQLDAGLSLRQGGKLVVDPGVEWRVGLDKLIELGWNSGEAEVQMVGTAAAPITIRGVDVRPGSWRGILVNGSIYRTSALKHLVIQHGGSNDGSALVLHSAITASDITFKDNNHEAFAIDAQGLSAESARFTVTDTKGVPGRVNAGALTSLPAGGSYRGNLNDYIQVDGGNITRTGTIPEVDVPLQVVGNVTLRNGAVLTVAPGAEFRMQSGVTWDMGWNTNPGTLKLIGSADKPIKFRGILEEPGFWDGILVESSITADSVMEYVQIGNAGPGSSANLALRAPISVRNCRLYGAAGFGISAAQSFMKDYAGQNMFEANAMGNLQLK